METQIHTLQKKEGALKKDRRRCRECNLQKRKASGEDKALIKVVHVDTYCAECPGEPPLCLNCFNKLHQKSVSTHISENQGEIQQVTPSVSAHVIPMLTMETEIHTLQKKEGALRKDCRDCSRQKRKASGEDKALIKRVHVDTYCAECPGKPPLCLNCSNKLHKKSVSTHVSEIQGEIQHVTTAVSAHVIPMLPMETEIHTLQKKEGALKKDRKSCRECNRQKRKASREDKALFKIVHVDTYCAECPGKPPLCSTCFNKLHQK